MFYWKILQFQPVPMSKKTPLPSFSFTFRPWWWHFHESLNLRWVKFYIPLTNHKPKQLTGCHSEYAFLWIQPNLIFPDSVKELPKCRHMTLSSLTGLDNHVMQKSSVCPLVSSTSVIKAEGHDSVKKSPQVPQGVVNAVLVMCSGSINIGLYPSNPSTNDNKSFQTV